ncbi:MAG: hypothetical protein RIS76_1927 [Verrucomicrobiota bacterium]
MAESQPGVNTVANSLFVDLVTLRAQQEALARQANPLAERRNSVQSRLSALPEKALRYARLKARQQSLESTRALLAGRQREAQLFAENSPGYDRLFAPATTDDVTISSRGRQVMGRVNTPGVCPLEGPMTVIEAITPAGGLFTSRFSGTYEELADLHHSFIIR